MKKEKKDIILRFRVNPSQYKKIKDQMRSKQFSTLSSFILYKLLDETFEIEERETIINRLKKIQFRLESNTKFKNLEFVKSDIEELIKQIQKGE